MSSEDASHKQPFLQYRGLRHKQRPPNGLFLLTKLRSDLGRARHIREHLVGRMLHQVVLALALALVPHPVLQRHAGVRKPGAAACRAAILRAQQSFANNDDFSNDGEETDWDRLKDFSNDGQEIDWDKEAAALVARGSTDENRFYKAIRAISPPDLVSEFARSAPKDVQVAVRATVGQLLGNLPAEVMDSAVTTSGKNLGSLMFSMQMTGYLFRNAEYRRSLSASLEGSSSSGLLSAADGDEGTPADPSLPPVSGTITVNIGEGMEAKVDAAAYMSELRNEVETLRSELLEVKKKEEEDNPAGGLITYIQSLSPEDAQGLQGDVSQDVLEAMCQLVSSLLIDMNIPYDANAAVTAPTAKLRELLITQLVAGYRLRELEARDALKDKFWS